MTGRTLSPLTLTPDLGTTGGITQVGNGFAVPVFARLLVALTLCLQPAVSSPSSLRLDLLLPSPMYSDILDDIFAPALELAKQFEDLATYFDLFSDLLGQTNS